MAERKAIPAAVKRQLLEECGYRCALPGCGQTVGLQRAHIEPHAETQDDSFENLIMLCGTDHYRYDTLGEITRDSIRTYKRNLAVMNGRYNDFERRILEHFHTEGLDTKIELDHSAGTDLSLRNLMRDKMLESTTGNLGTVAYDNGTVGIAIAGTKILPPRGESRLRPNIVSRAGGSDLYTLTEAGKMLVARWFGAAPIEADLA